MGKAKLYIDIDGVLLKYKADKAKDGISNFIRFIVSNFDCYWLTTHCKGNAQTAINYLSEYFSSDDLMLLQQVKATNWNTLKTEAIDFALDFYWIDDYALNAEKEILQMNGKIDSLILTNAYEDDLLEIKRKLSYKV
jgi:hypothetical protein